ncbi:MAG: hypothetical protein NTU69_08255, partial [Proteobacteria bacterium]|nr:hypothetical protein [Pseudomonadota bacterium]
MSHLNLYYHNLLESTTLNAQLVEKYWPFFKAEAFRMGCNGAAEDIAQGAIFKYLCTNKSPHFSKAYARCMLLWERRDEKRKEVLVDDIEVTEPSWDGGFVGAQEDQADSERIAEIGKNYGSKTADAVKMLREGYTIAELARSLKIPKKNVKQLLADIANGKGAGGFLLILLQPLDHAEELAGKDSSGGQLAVPPEDKVFGGNVVLPPKEQPTLINLGITKNLSKV